MALQHQSIRTGSGQGRARHHHVSWPSALVVLAGVWLLVTPLLLDRTGSRNGIWSDVATGAALVVIASMRLAFPVRTTVLGLVNVALGVWLIIAPFALHYHYPSDPGRANDLLVGIAVTALAMLSMVNCSFAWHPPRTRRI